MRVTDPTGPASDAGHPPDTQFGIASGLPMEDEELGELAERRPGLFTQLFYLTFVTLFGYALRVAAAAQAMRAALSRRGCDRS